MKPIEIDAGDAMCGFNFVHPLDARHSNVV
jgi:hypothetical protein